MPTSEPKAISFILEKIMEFKPKSVLDIGVGFGKWGVLCREYLDVWGAKEYNNWKTRIDGVEVHGAYWNPCHQIYNHISYKNVMDILDVVCEYDLVLLIDVLEHLKKSDGVKLLKRIGKHYIVSTPNGNYPQGEVFNNKYESHISNWQGYFKNPTIIGTQLIVFK